MHNLFALLSDFKNLKPRRSTGKTISLNNLPLGAILGVRLGPVQEALIGPELSFTFGQKKRG